MKLQKRKAIRDKVLTKRLSKNKFVAPAPVFSQREDITGNLRTITPVGNIAAQVLSNLQKRNMIEVTQRQLKYVYISFMSYLLRINLFFFKFS